MTAARGTGDAVVATRGLRRSFREPGSPPVQAVREATLAVRAGEVVLVIGPSGSGKTTLLSMVGGVLAADGGELTVCETDLRALGEEALPRFRLRNVGFVFQTFQLLDALTAEENVELPLHLAGRDRSESRARAGSLLAELGVADRAGARPRALSAGERQRVAVARALALEPPLLLADEPTGSLDSRSGAAVMDLLVDAVRRRHAALLIVSHDDRLRARADRVMAMADGVLIPEEPPSVADRRGSRGSGTAAPEPEEPPGEAPG